MKQNKGKPPDRLIEEISVGFSLLIASVSMIIYAGVQVISDPAIGGTFLGIGAFWLCVSTLTAGALVVLHVNINRLIQGAKADRRAILFATIILISLGGALYFEYTANRFLIAVAVGFVGLILAPLGLFVTVFESRFSHL